MVVRLVRLLVGGHLWCSFVRPIQETIIADDQCFSRVFARKKRKYRHIWRHVWIKREDILCKKVAESRNQPQITVNLDGNWKSITTGKLTRVVCQTSLPPRLGHGSIGRAENRNIYSQSESEPYSLLYDNVWHHGGIRCKQNEVNLKCSGITTRTACLLGYIDLNSILGHHGETDD